MVQEERSVVAAVCGGVELELMPQKENAWE